MRKGAGPNVVDRYWARPQAAILAELRSDRRGLSEDEARRRLQVYGPNLIQEEQRASALRLLLRQFENPLAIILIFAALIAAGLRDWLEAAIVLAIVLGSVILGFSQEYRATAAVAELRRRLQLTARVRRADQIIEAPFADIVPGDIICLSAGVIVPADALLLETKDLLVSEAVLTGESFPVEKRAGALVEGESLPGRANSVFLGSSVRSGTGEALVVATGRLSEFGGIARRLQPEEAPSEFTRSMRGFGLMLIRLMIGVVLFVLIVHQLQGRAFMDSLLFALALGVGMSPELLPAIISVTLSAGAQRLARSGVLVRRLEALENLGSMTVFCTDKTGTLTEGAVRLEGALSCQGEASDKVARLAYLNARLEAGIANPLDQAIRSFGEDRGLCVGALRKVAEIPYDFSRRRLSVVIEDPETPGELVLITKGAFDNVLNVCSRWEVEGGQDLPLDELARHEVLRRYQGYGEQGLRVLALATRRLSAKPDYSASDEAQMSLCGFLVFADPLKPEAAPAIAGLGARGVSVKILSGDNRHVVAHVAQALGLDPCAMLTGDQLARLTDEALERVAPDMILFSEVDPQQKERIIRALQKAGEAVGYLGDGVNDAPALTAADVGVSVQEAVDVARESADIVLLKRDLNVLKAGVEGGRRTFANTLKYIGVTTSANFGNMLSMALASPVLPFMPMTAKQILLNNFLSDIPAVALAGDSVDEAQIATPQRLSSKDIQRFMIVFGTISSAFDLLMFFVLAKVLHATEAVFQTTWFVLSLLSELAVLLVLRTQGPVTRSRPARRLLLISAFVAGIGLAAPYLGPLSDVFGFARLALPDLMALVAIVLAYLVATELMKRWFYADIDRRRRTVSRKPGHYSR